MVKRLKTLLQGLVLLEKSHKKQLIDLLPHLENFALKQLFEIFSELKSQENTLLKKLLKDANLRGQAEILINETKQVAKGDIFIKTKLKRL